MTEIFDIAPYYFGNGVKVKQIALVITQQPVYSRLCHSEDINTNVLCPLASIKRYGTTSAFCTEYRAALDADNTDRLDELSPRVAIGFPAYILSKIVWDTELKEWCLVCDIKTVYRDYFDAHATKGRYLDPEQRVKVIKAHLSNESGYLNQTQSLWESSGLNEFDKDARPLFEIVERYTQDYLDWVQLFQVPDDKPSELASLIFKKEKEPEIKQAIIKCNTANQLGETIRKYIVERVFTTKSVKDVFNAAQADGLTKDWGRRAVYGNGRKRKP